jgi:hypothetical protein
LQIKPEQGKLSHPGYRNVTHNRADGECDEVWCVPSATDVSYIHIEVKICPRNQGACYFSFEISLHFWGGAVTKIPDNRKSGFLT